MTAQWQNSRKIVERVFVEGKLILDTPASFGNGDADSLTDIPLLLDPVQGCALLTGASIAGALRSYLREYERGYGWDENPKAKEKSRAEELFGHLDDSDEERRKSVQSWLIVEDALGDAPKIELRDGVKIDAATRTAEAQKKFDVELLEAGTTFDLAFELMLTEKPEEMLEGLALALEGFEKGAIGLGRRKRRGYGECHVSEWTVRRYNVTTAQDLVGWLTNDKGGEQTGNDIQKLLQITPRMHDARDRMALNATFELDGSLLIRSGSGTADSPDFVHLKSRRNGREVPILSGTSVAGAIRARARRIANTIAPTQAETLINEMFGREIKSASDEPSGSRVIVRETKIVEPPEVELVQSRVKIDRFTGGAYPQALFQEQPLFPAQQTRVNIELELRKPEKKEVGLLLLVLKDLWTGDLPLGGESSIGRGRLRGVTATIRWDKEWTLTEKDGKIEVTGTGTRHELEDFVSALKEAR